MAITDPSVPASVLPTPEWRHIDGDHYWTLDWYAWMGVAPGRSPFPPGEQLQNSGVVARLRIPRSGWLQCRFSGECRVRWLREEKATIPTGVTLRERERLPVTTGDQLEITHWGGRTEWFWAAHLSEAEDEPDADPCTVLLPYLDRIRERMLRPNGPPIKFYSSGQSPVRAALALYSMLLNGYAPPYVLLYGEEQWTAATRAFFETVLPFATVVPQSDVLETVRSISRQGSVLADWARDNRFVMKFCVALLAPPFEFCLMNDDVFVLGPVDEALAALRRYELVYPSGRDNGSDYLPVWGWLYAHQAPAGTPEFPLDTSAATVFPTADFSVGQFWMRNLLDRRLLVADAARVPPPHRDVYIWEQGIIAALYAFRKTKALSPHRYAFPAIDGLPGGSIGYDYAANPCGYTTIHFGAIPKPDDIAALRIAPKLLDPPPGHRGNRATHTVTPVGITRAATT